MKTVSVNLMTILWSSDMKKSMMMLFSSNNDEKNAAIKNDSTSAVI